MIQEGILENPKPIAIIAQHVLPSLECGKVGFKAGMFMASADEIYIDIAGKGGHGALPHECIDPVVVASQVVLALQQLVSRNANPLTPTVLTIGKIQTDGGANNIITSKVRLEGTFRTMNEEWRRKAHHRITEIVNGVALAYGAEIHLDLVKGYPFLINHEALTSHLQQYACEYLGSDNVIELPMRLTAEDFAFYSQHLPACFYRIGVANPTKGSNASLHTPTFDVDENSLEIGMGLMSWIALQELSGNSVL
jgi:amidohydrolase